MFCVDGRRRTMPKRGKAREQRGAQRREATTSCGLPQPPGRRKGRRTGREEAVETRRDAGIAKRTGATRVLALMTTETTRGRRVVSPANDSSGPTQYLSPALSCKCRRRDASSALILQLRLQTDAEVAKRRADTTRDVARILMAGPPSETRKARTTTSCRRRKTSACVCALRHRWSGQLFCCRIVLPA